MSYDGVESSRQDGLPITLFRFEIGSTVYCYTTAEDSVDHGGLTYLPIPIKYDRIVANVGSDRRRTNVSMHFKEDFARLFFGPHPVFWAITLTIGEGHLGESEFIERFHGYMSGAVFAKNVFTASFDTKQVEAARPGLRRVYQQTCPHVLYGDACQASRPSFTVTASVAGISGADVTLSAGWNIPHDKDRYLYGELLWSMQHGVARASILAVDGAQDRLTLSVVPEGLTVGASVTLSLGCDKVYGTCRDVFSNLPHFGGTITEPIANGMPFGGPS